MRRGGTLILLLLFAPPLLAAEWERLVPRTSIKGVQATPRVSFIIPWQRSRMREFPLTPSHSVLDELYEPLSSQQLLRESELYGNNNRVAQP